jgi:antitoxin (DNA-binding transcriptional repressor) of toxin-antitoxin stability system
VVTASGRPSARVVPISRPVNGVRGTVRVLAEDERALYSVPDAWKPEPSI